MKLAVPKSISAVPRRTIPLLRNIQKASFYIYSPNDDRRLGYAIQWSFPQEELRVRHCIPEMDLGSHTLTYRATKDPGLEPGGPTTDRTPLLDHFT
jgi:hypothetical protein